MICTCRLGSLQAIVYMLITMEQVKSLLGAHALVIRGGLGVANLGLLVTRQPEAPRFPPIRLGGDWVNAG